MSVELINMLPTVLLGAMIVLTLILLPRLNDERRRDDASEASPTAPPDQSHHG